MKAFQKSVIVSVLISVGLLVSCSGDTTNNDLGYNFLSEEILTVDPMTDTDSDALLFMLEEEKLARDTYIYLNDLWSVNQFANIKNSEQSHMNAVANLLEAYGVDFTILPEGQFYDEELQLLYDQFVVDGSIGLYNALQIGATIEDLDIVDLQDYINATDNVNLIHVFESLQCGSRNHLRSFMTAIMNNGDTYAPQFLTQTDFDAILAGTHEQCN